MPSISYKHCFMPPDPELEESRSLASGKLPTTNVTAGTGGGVAIEIDTAEIVALRQAKDSFATRLVAIVGGCLKMRAEGQWSRADDDIFLTHSLLIEKLLPRSRSAPISGLELVPVRLWEDHILPLCRQTEAQMRITHPAARIHKGAPLFNVGLCLFLSGDFDRAFQYFAEAAKEDELSGRGSRRTLVIGDHPLAERVIIDPLVRDLLPHWVSDYSSVTGALLDKAELQSVLRWLIFRAPDAFQVVASLHRLRESAHSPENEVSMFQLVRAVAEIVLSIESSLRRWQTGASGQLQARTENLLAGTAAHPSFAQFHTNFCNTFSKPARDTAGAVNWVIQQVPGRLAAVTSCAPRIGIIAYLAVRLRNSLMHVNEEALDIHSNRSLCIKIAGQMFSMIRISKFGQEGLLGTIL